MQRRIAALHVSGGDGKEVRDRGVKELLKLNILELGSLASFCWSH